MNYYQPYNQNRIINPFEGTSEPRDLSTIELLQPNIIETREGRIVDYTKYIFTDAKGFEKTLDMRGANPRVRPWTRVYISITELDRDNKPFMGLASMEVHNIVPKDDYITVRGHIGWESNLKAQLSVFWI